MPVISGNVRAITGATLPNPTLYVHASRPSLSRASGRLTADMPVQVPVRFDGTFSTNVEDTDALISLEVRYQEQSGAAVGRSWWSPDFRVPTGGGDVADLIVIPPQNGRVRVIDGGSPGGLHDQYVYDEQTGQLYERTS